MTNDYISRADALAVAQYSKDPVDGILNLPGVFGWISVEDRLPGTERILITDGELVKEGYRRPDGVWKYGREEYLLWSQLSIYPVTHWMPLPEPPKEESK